MKKQMDKVRIEISNYNPSYSEGSSVSYHMNAEDTEKILDLIRVNIESGMYVLIYPWWHEEE